MQFSSLTNRMLNDGAEAWRVHSKAVAAFERGEDVIVLSVGDPEFATPAPASERAIEAIRSGDTHYPPIAGRNELREAIARNFSASSGQAYTADDVVVCSGTQNALLAASLCLLDHGDEVVGLDPMYVTYESTLRLGGADLVRVPQRSTDGFRPDLDAIASAVTPRTRAIAITTPNNPTGVVLTNDELEGIARIARANDLWVISDEVYADLVFDGQHRSIAALEGMRERTLVVSSLSKSHAMTGWRCGWVLGPSGAIAHIENLQTNVNYGVPGFVQEAALAALTSCEPDVEDMRETYRRRRDLAHERLSGFSELDVLLPEAGMYLLVHVAPYARSVPEFVESLYEDTGVSVLDAGAFGPSAEGWVRLSFATDDESLLDGCGRLLRFLER